jgi:hypothetical protein
MLGGVGGSHWKRLAGGAGACLVAAGALSACGSSTPAGSPKVQLKSSISSLGSSPTLSINFHLSATPAQLHALAPSIPTPYASLITGASVVLKETTTNGASLNSVRDAAEASGSPTAAIDSLRQVDVDLAVNGGGNELMELRLVNGVLYARADVKDILALVGKTSSDLSSVASSLPSGSQFDFARAALGGKWVSLNVVSALQGYLSTAPVVKQSQSKASLAKVIKAFDTLYADDVTVAAAGSGPNGTSKLAVSANARTLLTGLDNTLMQINPAVSAKGDLSKVPDRTFSADAFLNGTALTGIQLNLSQFIHGGVSATTKPLELAATISHPSVSISAPTSSTPASIAALGQLFAGLGGSAPGLSSGSGLGFPPATA